MSITLEENIPVKYLSPGTPKLDFKFDFAPATNNPNKSGLSDWLLTGETIASFTPSVPSGITLDSSDIEDAATSVVLWLIPNAVIEKQTYRAAVTITTSAGRIDTRNLDLYIEDR